MFQLTLLPSLALPAFAPLVLPVSPAIDELSRALPADALAVVLMGDLHAACTGEDAGRWGQMLADARWRDIILRVAEADVEAEGDVDELGHALDLGLDMLEGTRGAALAVLDEDGQRTAGLAEVDQGWLERAIADGESNGMKLETVDALGRKAYTHEATEGTLLIVPIGERVVLATDVDLEAATASAGQIAAALEAGADDDERWWLAYAGRVAGAEAELLINGAAMTADDAEESLDASIGELRTIYMAIDLGAGNAAEMVMQLESAGGPGLEEFAAIMLPADAGLLAHVPVSYSGTVIGLDMDRAIAGMLSLASEEDADAEAQYEQGLEAMNSALGIDFEADVLAHLSGQLLLLQPPMDFAALAEVEDESELPIEQFAPTLAFGIDDVDAVLEFVEVLVGTVESQGLVIESAEVAGSSLWIIDSGMDFSVGLGVGRGFLAVGPEAGVVALLEALAKPEEDHAIAKATIAALEPELEGVLVTISPVEAMFEMMDSIASMAETFAASEEDPYAAVMLEAVATVGEIGADHLAGAMAGDLRITTTGFSYRMFAR